jgi:hypothetical protein
MTWTDDMAMLAEAVSDVDTGFGEPIVTPVGQLIGVVGLPATQPMLRVSGSRSGSIDLLQHQSEPTCTLRTSDAGALSEGDTITMRGTDYSVIELLPDGGSMTLLRLVPAAATPADPLPTGAGWR